jgi:glycosyltransferase involved in cell wall biosynthesis
VEHVDAHWLVPCAFPIALGAAPRATLEVILHGSDVRLLAALPRLFQSHLAEQLIESGAKFRFVAESLRSDFVARLAPKLADAVLGASRIEPAMLKFPPNIVRAPRSPGEPLRALLVGRLIASKRMDWALSALGADAEPWAQVAVIGAGPERRALEKRFVKATFLGALPHLATLEHIGRADVLINASTQEGAPSVIREALALGTPVVSRSVGPREAFEKLYPTVRSCESAAELQAHLADLRTCV